jgi:multidrug efflux system membrane fusion protein
VTAVVTLARQPDALVVPAAAIQDGQQGAYVFLVAADSTVDLRPVRIERTVGALAVVAQGLEAGDTVVTDGQLRLVPGSRVTVRSDSPAPVIQ